MNDNSKQPNPAALNLFNEGWEHPLKSKRSDSSKSVSKSVSFDEEAQPPRKKTPPHHEKNQASFGTEQSYPRGGRATVGMMGNGPSVIIPQKANTLSMSREATSPSVVSPGQKSFRVSFGKTLSMSNFGSKEKEKEKEKPRFDIVPNQRICIVEAPSKKRIGSTHSTQPRNFNIISHEVQSSDGQASAKSRILPDNINTPTNITPTANSNPQLPTIDLSSPRINA